MSISVFVVEDEMIHQEAIKIALEECGFELAGLCNNADEAFHEIKKHQPDIILIDIALPGLNNGITLASKIHSELHVPHIFTTSFTQDEVIREAAKTSPSGYLTKPVDSDNLKASIVLALSQSAPESDERSKCCDCFYTKVGDQLLRIDYQEILMVKSDGSNYISIITEQKEVNCRCTLKEFGKELPAHFLQTHRAYIINTKQLDSFNEKEQAAMLKGKAAPVARSYKTSFLNHLKKW